LALLTELLVFCHKVAAVFVRNVRFLEATSCFAIYDRLRSFIMFEFSNLCAGNGAARRRTAGRVWRGR